MMPLRKPELNGFTVSLSKDDLAAISQYARQNIGISIDDSKHGILLARISRRMNEIKSKCFSEYFSILKSGRDPEEEAFFISLLTTNITSFFREHHHFDLLIRHLNDGVSSKAGHRKTKIWSAGCSTGQEAYSISFSVQEICDRMPEFDIDILASDIDRKVLQKAERGIYADSEINSLSIDERRKYFSPHHEGMGNFVVRRKYKERVSFENLNLVNLPEAPCGIDYIFCRNVVIYFDRETQINLWGEFYNRLNEGGVLFLGQAERLPAEFEESFTKIGKTAYEKKLPKDDRRNTNVLA